MNETFGHGDIGLNNLKCSDYISQTQFKGIKNTFWISNEVITVRTIDKLFATGKVIGFNLRLYYIDKVLIFEFETIFPDNCISEKANSAFVLSNGEILKYTNGSGYNCESNYSINVGEVFGNENDKIKLSNYCISKIRINIGRNHLIIPLNDETQQLIRDTIKCLVNK